MSKVGLKGTLSLLAAGYKKKDIEALAAIDDELDNTTSLSSNEAQEAGSAVPEPQKEETVPDSEPDYKKMYEELLEKNKKTEAKVTKLQQDNVHKDSAPASDEFKKKQEESLENLFRSFM